MLLLLKVLTMLCLRELTEIELGSFCRCPVQRKTELTPSFHLKGVLKRREEILNIPPPLKEHLSANQSIIHLEQNLIINTGDK